jgi:hypothetical protein
VEEGGPPRERNLDGLDAQSSQLARTPATTVGTASRFRRSTSTPEDQVIVKRDRDDFARAASAVGAEQNTRRVFIEAPRLIELEMHVGYARDLLAELRGALGASGAAFEGATIKIDLPVSVCLSPVQVEQLIEKLAAVTQ